MYALNRVVKKKILSLKIFFDLYIFNILMIKFNQFFVNFSSNIQSFNLIVN